MRDKRDGSTWDRPGREDDAVTGRRRAGNSKSISPSASTPATIHASIRPSRRQRSRAVAAAAKMVAAAGGVGGRCARSRITSRTVNSRGTYPRPVRRPPRSWILLYALVRGTVLQMCAHRRSDLGSRPPCSKTISYRLSKSATCRTSSLYPF